MLVRHVIGPSRVSRPMARLLSSTQVSRDDYGNDRFGGDRPRRQYESRDPAQVRFGRNPGYSNQGYSNQGYSNTFPRRDGQGFQGQGFRGPPAGGFQGPRPDKKAMEMKRAQNLAGKSFGRYKRPGPPPSLLTLADLSPEQISSAVVHSLAIKYACTQLHPTMIPDLLDRATVALIFSKRSTRTRVASESAANILKGSTMFLGKEDGQLGVNETLEDTAKVVGSMTEGFMARVNGHEDVEALAKYSPVPVINALSDLYHPTQILADLMTIVEMYNPPIEVPEEARVHFGAIRGHLNRTFEPFECLKGKKIAWVGDTNNISNELLVTVPRLGMEFAIASPEGYNKVDQRVWARVEEAGTVDKVTLTTDPAVALKDADIVVTDTWISMGQEEEKAARLSAFSGYQITNEMVKSAGAKPDWKFMHCLPRKQEEVDDEVFYGNRSVVFQEAENRKWTTAACFAEIIAGWRLWNRAALRAAEKESVGEQGDAAEGL